MIESPFTILFDQRERRGPPYAFNGIYLDASHPAARRHARQHRNSNDAGSWDGKPPLVAVRTRVAHLVTGDYTIEGFADRITVERKGGAGGVADLYRTISQSRKRFTKQLTRMQEMEFAAVVIEAEWSTIMNFPPPRSQLPAKNVYRSILAWMVRFPCVQWLCVPGREMAEVVCYRLLEKFWQQAQQRAVTSAASAAKAAALEGRV